MLYSIACHLEKHPDSSPRHPAPVQPGPSKGGFLSIFKHYLHGLPRALPYPSVPPPHPPTCILSVPLPGILSHQTVTQLCHLSTEVSAQGQSPGPLLSPAHENKALYHALPVAPKCHNILLNPHHSIFLWMDCFLADPRLPTRM